MPRCAENSPILCTPPLFDDPSQDNSSEPNTASPDEAGDQELEPMETTTAIADEATPTNMPITIPLLPPTTVTPLAIDPGVSSTSPPLGEEGEEGHLMSIRDMESLAEEEGVTTSSPDDGLTLSTAALAFIIVGGVFFVVLVVLVFILLACLFPRNSVKKTFVPTAMEDAASE